MDAQTYFLLASGSSVVPVPPPQIPKIGIAGQFFTLDGQPWTAIECSDFSLYKRYLDGEDIRPVLAERQASIHAKPQREPVALTSLERIPTPLCFRFPRSRRQPHDADRHAINTHTNVKAVLVP